MTRELNHAVEERDCLHILPLTAVPLHIASLKRARLLKNSRLESVVELFSGQEVGSGQIYPDELDKVFDFTGETEGDLEIITSLGKLSSYDVFSLRVEMRKLGINVEDHEQLRLSEEMTNSLSDYMATFTQPLIKAVYGDAVQNVRSYAEMLGLFMSPDQGAARKNLRNLAAMLDIHITDIPLFLQDYGDVYLSLAYYRHCNEKNIDNMTEFFDWIHEIQSDPVARANKEFIRVSELVEEVVRRTARDIHQTLEVFEARTSDMWDDPTAEKFQDIRKLITEYQSRIGGALCVVSVKLDAWARNFQARRPAAVQRRVGFVISEMSHGLDKIERAGVAA